jgi:hypothetical protein
MNEIDGPLLGKAYLFRRNWQELGRGCAHLFHYFHKVFLHWIYRQIYKQNIAYDREEYIEGMVAFAKPIKVNSRDLQAVIWAVGLIH